MKYYFFKLSLVCVCITMAISLHAQDTFSIVGLDSATREVGSAGASCVDLFTTSFADGFLGDLFPNRGAINTQAQYLVGNQTNAKKRMDAGDTPAKIISWLAANDIQQNPTIRQYGVVAFTGNNISAAGYTGINCMDYKNHITGSVNGFYYSVQGNILLGKKVLDSIEFRFRNEPGDLACKLMAALQGGKMIGADTRCAPNQSSTLFAYLKVSKPTDVYGSPSFFIAVRTHDKAMIEPVDTLQKKFNLVRSPCNLLSSISPTTFNQTLFKIYPNPANTVINIEADKKLIGSVYSIFDPIGKQVLSGQITAEILVVDINQLPTGIYFIQVGNSTKQSFSLVKN